MTAEFDYDLIVIGAGSGGVRAGQIAAGFGARVAVLKKTDLVALVLSEAVSPRSFWCMGQHWQRRNAAGFGWSIDKTVPD